MDHWIFGALIGLLGGVAIAFLNFALSRAVIRKKPAVYASFSIVRQVIHILYLVALYLLAPLTPWGRVELLVGGVIGMTLPMLLLTPRLVREMRQASLTERTAGSAQRQAPPEEAASQRTEGNAGAQQSPRQAPPGGEKQTEDESEVIDRG